jgi:NADPH:quinone reductase-like Zn-dependent oxidoreductase
MRTVDSHASVLPSATTAARTMQAIVHRRYGEPGVLAYDTLERPVPADDEVLVRVHAAGVSIGDHHIVSGKPYLVRLSPFGGFPTPRNPVPGGAIAGVVEAIGPKVTSFHVGDAVYGQGTTGAWAEYVAIPAALLAKKPSKLSFEEAAAVPWGTTALNGLRDAGGLKAGQRLLVNGASGAVGVWAVQIGKALGAHVTAVCSTRNVELVRSLGADEVIDYGKEDFVAAGPRFDVLFDMVGNRVLSDCRRVLVPGGAYVPCSGGGGDWIGPFVRIIAGLIVFAFGGRRLKLFVQKPCAADLAFMTELIESGRARPVVERVFPLSEAADALRHVGEGHARGVTVLRVAG